MLLAIDIGNTNTVVGVFDGKTLLAHFRVTSQPLLTVDEAGLFVSSLFSRHITASIDQVSEVAICSVVPPLTGVYKKMAQRYFSVDPIIISPALKLPVTIDYPEPSEIGADRLANAAAGYDRLGKALIVVDLGTATTFDIVSEKGEYIGGVIAPGSQAAGGNLARKAARLFEVGVEKPGRIIGKSTSDAIKSGLFYGTIGVIDHILELIFDELGEKPTVLATGGEAETYCRESKYIEEIIPTLTLEGIRLIAELNQP
ncbi:MAG: type III pantothenate kinase [Candidatus Thorarchaeota archaeon]